MKPRFFHALFPGLLGAALASHGSEGVTPEQREFFEKKIRPVLVSQCYECHAVGAKKIGGKLLLDSPAALRKGGESGSPVVAGKPQESLLLHALRYEHDLEMPPEKPLPEAVIADFARWIEMGAPDPREAVPVPEGTITERRYKEGDLWSFTAPGKSPPPAVRDSSWPRGTVDRFTLAAMEAQGLTPAPDTDPRTLARRLYFDLIGLPPTYAEVRLFEAAALVDREAAVEKLVDELLASPHFGERWGRHWLDVARYGESNGNDGLSRNPSFPHAWRYRDYVIDAFNRDLPYDRFLTEQIAGDLLESDSPDERDRHRIATGFLALGAKPAKAMNDNFEMDVVADQIEVVGTGLLGLSIGCARCHDHKFDPIPTRDYYAMAGFFTGSETLWGVAANEKLTAPPTDLHVLEAAPKVLPPYGFVENVLVIQSNTGIPLKPPPPKWAPGTPLAMGMRDRKEPADCKINLKGESKKTGESVPRGFLSAVKTNTAITPDSKTSGRLQLAQWITSPDHPQTARVLVNRLWLHLFGEGLVRTPNDFGVYGEKPTHPALLDHLAIEFVGGGWSVKSLIRSLVLSRTYQLAGTSGEAVTAEHPDPENRWLSYHSRRRLDAEALRDAMLRVSGRLDPRPADGSLIRHRDILINLADNLHEPSPHRSIYLCYLRNSPPPDLAAFDLPDFIGVTGKRDVSTVPGHTLFLFNNPFVLEQSVHFAKSLLTDAESDEVRRITRAYEDAFNRAPDPEELYRAAELIAATANETGSPETAWAAFTQALFAANEFRYLD